MNPSEKGRFCWALEVLKVIELRKSGGIYLILAQVGLFLTFLLISRLMAFPGTLIQLVPVPILLVPFLYMWSFHLYLHLHVHVHQIQVTRSFRQEYARDLFPSLPVRLTERISRVGRRIVPVAWIDE